MTAPASGIDRLIYFVDARLAQLGMTKEELAHRGGPAVDTLQKLRKRGGSAKPSFETFQRYDAALGWQPGSAAVTMLGDEPRGLTTAPRVGRRRSATPLEAGDIVTTFLSGLGSEITELERLRDGVDTRIMHLRSIRGGLRDVLDAHDEPPVGPGARAARRHRRRAERDAGA